MPDTIFAVSSGRPPAAIAVIRISGPGAIAAVGLLAGTLPAARRAGLRTLRDHAGDALDQALVLVFPGPDTATGEDLVELHCHGSRAVVAAVQQALAGMPGMRLAQAGEFTRRALFNGRIDLAQAQGLADLLQAETEAQRIVALSGVEGRISRLVGEWTDRITTLAAMIEASLDFAEEDDVGDDAALVESVRSGMANVAADIDRVLRAPPVERIRDGVCVVLAGPTNAGKSTLFNLLCGREAAIVSPVAGTTRDRVEASVRRGGMAYSLVDTAGLNPDAADVIEEEGIVRARRATDAADVLLWLGDDGPPRGDALWVQARADLPDRAVMRAGRTVMVSERDGASIDRLWDMIEAAASPMLATAADCSLHAYQRDACRRARAYLGQVGADPILLAEQLRLARGELTGLTAHAASDQMLDRLFGAFCIGK